MFKAVYEVVEGEVIALVVATAENGPTPWDGAVAGLRTFLDACLEPSFRRIVILDSVSVLQARAAEGGIEQVEMSMLVAVLTPLTATSPELAGVPVRPPAYVALDGLDGAALYIARSDKPKKARAEADIVLDRIVGGLRAAAAG